MSADISSGQSIRPLITGNRFVKDNPKKKKNNNEDETNEQKAKKNTKDNNEEEEFIDDGFLPNTGTNIDIVI